MHFSLIRYNNLTKRINTHWNYSKSPISGIHSSKWWTHLSAPPWGSSSSSSSSSHSFPCFSHSKEPPLQNQQQHFLPVLQVTKAMKPSQDEEEKKGLWFREWKKTSYLYSIALVYKLKGWSSKKYNIYIYNPFVRRRHQSTGVEQTLALYGRLFKWTECDWFAASNEYVSPTQ